MKRTTALLILVPTFALASVIVAGPSIKGPSANAAPQFQAAAKPDKKPDAEPAYEKVPDQYIVVFKDDVADPEAAADDLGVKHGLGVTQKYKHAMKGFAAVITSDKLDRVRGDARVDFISEDRVVTATAAKKPVPPPSTQSLPTGIDRINAENKTNKGAGVNVAVIDTGIDLTHPDLQANIVGGKNCLSGKTYADGNGHGTHVAGTIAAIDNTAGVVGVAPAAKLWAVRVLDNSGSGTWSSVICGLDFVTSNAPANGGPIKVANMSLSGGGTSDNNCGNTNADALHKAVCRARNAGVTIVVAAGNSGLDAATSVPAAYDDAVITVSALADSDGKVGGLGGTTGYGADDTFASFSNFGAAVDIGAPGANINSTWMGGGYKAISGTSMASPHVAGVAALYIATHPLAPWTEVKQALMSVGEALNAGHTDPSGKHPEPVLRADSF
jgi:subtilisin family serine protease